METQETPGAVLAVDESLDVSQDDNHDANDDSDDEDYVYSLEDSGASGYNTTKYNHAIREIMGCGVSDRHGARVVNGVIMDLVAMGKLQFDETLLVTKSKVQYQKGSISKAIIKQHEEDVTGLKSIGFDGKKSRTCQEHSQKIVQDKQTVICNITRKYVSSFIPEDGTGEECASGVIEVSCFSCFFSLNIYPFSTFLL